MSAQTSDETFEIQGTTVEVGESYWRENSNSSIRSRFLPLTVNDKEVEAPIGNIDVLDIPCGLDAQFVAMFEGDTVIAYENHDGITHALRYVPATEEWHAENIPEEDAAPWSDIIAEDDVVWKSDDHKVDL